MTAPLEILGLPTSPYTRKLVAYMRFRRIPHVVRWHYGKPPEGLAAPKLTLLPVVIVDDPETESRVILVDSTPIIRRFEASHSDRPTLPSDPVLGFVNDLIEDYADEWLTKVMFHFRWKSEQHSRSLEHLLAFHIDPTQDARIAAQKAEQIGQRQLDRLPLVGSNAQTQDAIEQSLPRLLAILDDLIEGPGFLFGPWPSSADFALFGQLTQLAQIDPEPVAMVLERYPRVRAWVDRTDDLSGHDRGDANCAPTLSRLEDLRPLLAEIGEAYGKVMLANARAISSGHGHFEARVRDSAWRQDVFRYHARCVDDLGRSFAGLTATQRRDVLSFFPAGPCRDTMADLFQFARTGARR